MSRESPRHSSEKENRPASGKSSLGNKSNERNNEAKQKRVLDEMDERVNQDEGDDMQVDIDDEEEEEEEQMQQTSSSSSSSRRASKGKGKQSTTNQNIQQDEIEIEDMDAEEQDANDSDTVPQGQEAEKEEEEEEEAYDPDQSMHEKRKVRKDYRDLTSGLMAERARNPDNVTVSSLRNNLQKGNELFHNVKTPAEAVLDSNFLMVTSEMALQQARKLKVGGDFFDADDFVGKLKMLVMGGSVRSQGRGAGNQGSARRGSGRRAVSVDDDDDEEEEDELEAPARDPTIGWDIIGKLATRHTLRVPPIDFMLGPLSIPQKKKTQKQARARHEKMDAADKVRPQEIQHGDIEEEKQTTELVMHVAETLEKVGGVAGINLFKFLINPESYPQTVENIFFTSFLVKDRKAAIEIDDSGQPIIYAAEPPSEEQKGDGELMPRQLVIELDMRMWKDAIEAYDITESSIPTREYKAKQKGKWYG